MTDETGPRRPRCVRTRRALPRTVSVSYGAVLDEGPVVRRLEDGEDVERVAVPILTDSFAGSSRLSARRAARKAGEPRVDGVMAEGACAGPRGRGSPPVAVARNELRLELAGVEGLRGGSRTKVRLVCGRRICRASGEAGDKAGVHLPGSEPSTTRGGRPSAGRARQRVRAHGERARRRGRLRADGHAVRWGPLPQRPLAGPIDPPRRNDDGRRCEAENLVALRHALVGGVRRPLPARMDAEFAGAQIIFGNPSLGVAGRAVATTLRGTRQKKKKKPRR